MTSITERAPAHPSPSGVLAARPLAFVAVVGVLVANLASALPRLDIGSRQLFDTDGYMRATRVLDLVTGRNAWFDGWVHQANAPFGHSMHWTRPLDALMIGVAAPAAPFVGWRDAVYFAALIVGPFLHVAIALTVAWVARALMDPGPAYLAGLAVAVQPAILSYASLARPDHHALILLLAVLLAGCVLRMLAGSVRAAVGGGVVAALGLWVSTESLLPIGLAMAALGLNAVLRPEYAPSISIMARSLTATTLIALVIERGSDWTAVEYDRISVVHLVVAGGFLLVAEGMRWTGRRALGRRVVVSAALTMGVAGVLGLAFPGFWAGPFVDVPDELSSYWLSRVAELAPLWSAASHRWTDTMFLVGSTLLGVIAVVAAVVRAHRDRKPVASWLFLGAWIVITALLAITSVRFVLYPEALAAVPLAWWAGDYLRGRTARNRSVRPWLRVLVMAAVVVGFAVPVGIARGFEGPAPTNQATASCDLRSGAAAVEAIVEGESLSRPVILASIDSGPELLWRLPVRVVATPYHRNAEGILDAAAILSSDSPAEASALLDQRQITWVLVCSGDPEGPGFGSEALWRRLNEGSDLEGWPFDKGLRVGSIALYRFDGAG